MDNNKHLVFVYGTLRRGGVRALPGLFPGAKFVGAARVSGRLYDLGAYPALLLEDSDSSVVGEVYEVDDEILHGLDEYEATADYRRQQVEVSLGQRAQTCWVYAPDPESYPRRGLIKSGDWIEHARTKTERPEGAPPDEA
ncbi:MAG TPA: gamma-glutamylcyclotransferase family protein [Pyrinomonadaceae bacterium]|jgi:gamma-glutamylcyclotransferase (GGCT)/AIG2-like uncharacterized protein YtfP